MMDRRRGCIPVGFKFHPTDQDLIGHYLSPKTNPNSDPWISLVDLYGDKEPWTIWQEHGGPLLDDEDLIFFTKLKRVKKNRVSRKIGSGTWSQGDVPKPVYAKNNPKDLIGRKTKLRYESKTQTHQSGCWFMDEYTSAVNPGDYVICRLRENTAAGKRPSSSQNNHGPKTSKRSRLSDDDDDSIATTNDESTASVSHNHDQQHLLLQTSTSNYEEHLMSQTSTSNDQRDALSHQHPETCLPSFEPPNATVVDGPEESCDDWLGAALEVAQETESGNDQTELVNTSAQVSTLLDEEFSFAYDDFPLDEAYINSAEFTNYTFWDEDGIIGTEDTLLQGSSSFSKLLEDPQHQL